MVYEVVWTRMLIVVFGTTVFAASTVLAAFMGGMALGSFSFGRFADRHGHPLRLYGLLQIGIGVFAFLFPTLLAGTDAIYVRLYRGLAGSFYLFSLIRFLLGFALLLIPTTLMGATLPVVSKFVIRRLERLGGHVGGLYSINTLGAVVGCFGATFFMIAYFGVRESAYIAAVLNLLIGGGALVLSRTVHDRAADASKKDEAETKDRAKCKVQSAKCEVMQKAPPGSSLVSRPDERREGRIVLWAFGLSGFAALGYEVVWMRLLGIVLTSNTAYAFGIMLISFLTGIALGSFVFGRIADRRRDLFSIFGSVEVLIGLFGLFSVTLFGGLPRVVGVLGTSSWWGYVGGRFAASGLLMLFPTFLMGGAFPLVSRIYATRLTAVGKSIGNIYAANTVGAILGSFAAGFLLIPSVGTQGTIQVLAFVNLTVGLWILRLGGLGRRLKIGLSFGTALIALLGWFGIAKDALVDVYRSSEQDAELVYWDDGAAGTVTVHRYKDGNLLMKVNGGGEVPTDYASLQTFRMLGHLPLLLHPDPQDVLVIALGGGIALGAAVQHDSRRIDCVEIAEGVVEGGRHFSEFNHNVLERLDDPNLTLIFDDGRNYVLSTDRTYDVITGDATHPASSDSWALYTKQFYALCRAKLNEGGIMCQWLPMHGLAEADYRMILHTFQTVFPHTTLWLFNEYTIMLGTLEPLNIDFGRLKARMQRENVRSSLAEVGLDDPTALLSAFAMDEEAVSEFVRGSRINTDDHPYISFSEQRRYGMAAGLPNLYNVGERLSEVFPWLTHIGEEGTTLRETLARYRRAKKPLIRGNIFRRGGMPKEAAEQYRRALEINPDERDAQYFLEQVSERPGPSAITYARIASMYERRGLYDRALSEYRKALEIEPDNVKILSNLGNLYHRTGRTEEAIAALKSAVERDPNFFGGHFNLANLYHKEKRYQEAKSEYRKALKIKPDSALALYYLGSLYEKEGRREEALRQYRLALNYAPKDSPLRRALSKAVARLD